MPIWSKYHPRDECDADGRIRVQAKSPEHLDMAVPAAEQNKVLQQLGDNVLTTRTIYFE